MTWLDNIIVSILWIWNAFTFNRIFNKWAYDKYWEWINKNASSWDRFIPIKKLVMYISILQYNECFIAITGWCDCYVTVVHQYTWILCIVQLYSWQCLSYIHLLIVLLKVIMFHIHNVLTIIFIQSSHSFMSLY